ncbi:hypothetical protein OAM47_02740 [Gammaproteobacteria bacterium]|mgnify:FL=1|jgi:hypothetical protein|nr:hypothetical protein [Gammaproteobacteria bacterium]|tara:strand:+ start:2087 stop:2404 length:318 start_codon:yes stop_codon:yes gene_type:complete
MKVFTKRLNKILSKLQESFLEENRENKKMLDIYIKFAEGSASSDELELANSQLRQILKNLGLGILLILPFSPITLPYIFSKAKELEIDLIPNWYKSLSNDDDRLE